MRGRWKLVWTPFQAPEREFALYDLEADPDENHDLYRPDHPEARALRGELEGWLRATDDRTETALDARDVELLRSLGYVE